MWQGAIGQLHHGQYSSSRILHMLGKIVWSFQSDSKMKSSRRISTVQFLQRLTWNWWRNAWVRVESFSSTQVMADPPKDQKWSARSTHWIWGLWRLKHLHVYVQWHGNKNRKRSELYFEFSNTKHVRVDSRKDTGHVYVQEMKRYDTEPSAGGKQYSWVALMVELKETAYPVFEIIIALSRWILRRKNNRDTIHFNVDASNTEVLLRTSHSANRFSIYGKISSWCGTVRTTAVRERAEFGKVRDRDKRKWTTTEEFITARSKYFDANSQEWWSNTWK